jgi:hypothetical protein
MGPEVLSLNPVSLMFGENGRSTHLGAATAADIDSAPDGLTVKVTAVPSHGTVLKEDGVTTHVASYHTNGDYSADPNYFATAKTNGPLTAPARQRWQRGLRIRQHQPFPDQQFQFDKLRS